jgi:hypothetical protein
VRCLKIAHDASFKLFLLFVTPSLPFVLSGLAVHCGSVSRETHKNIWRWRTPSDASPPLKPLDPSRNVTPHYGPAIADR